MYRRHPIHIVLAAGLLLGFGLSTVATAYAIPASPAFLKSWEAGDKALASSDIIAAGRSLDPILPAAALLDDGGQRLWFADTAARFLALTGRDTEAKRFLDDGQRISASERTRFDAMMATNPIIASPDWDERLRDKPGPEPRIDIPATFTEGEMFALEARLRPRFHAIKFGSPLDVELLTSKTLERAHVVLQGRVPMEATTAREVRSDYFPGFGPSYGFLKRVPGGALAAPSYFVGCVSGPVQQSRFNSIPQYMCALRVQRRSGGPTGIQSGTGRYVVTIPSTSTIVSKRRVARGARITVQAFATRNRKLVATWRPVDKRGNRLAKAAIRARYTIQANQATIRAPGRAGRYDLQVGVHRASDLGTAISGVGVGTSPVSTSSGPSKGATGKGGK